LKRLMKEIESDQKSINKFLVVRIQFQSRSVFPKKMQNSNSMINFQQSMSMKPLSNYRSLSTLPKNNISVSSPPHISKTKDQTFFQPLTSPRKTFSFSAKSPSASGKVPSDMGQQKCQPLDFPIGHLPLSKTNSVVIRNSEKLDEVLKVIAGVFNGAEVNIGKATVRARLEHGTDIKIRAFKVSGAGLENAKTILEFNRLDGCVFTFQKAMIKAKLAAAEYFENIDNEKLKEELLKVEERLALWYDDDDTDNQSSTNALTPSLTLGNATVA